MVVYLVTNKVNGKQYVGQTIHSLSRRWSWHCHYSSGCLALHSAIEKYGPDNFEIRVIDEAKDRDELDEKETMWIERLNTLAPNGYNLKTGGKHCTYSAESLEKMSRAHKGLLVGEKNPNYGKKLTAEQRAEIGRHSKGRLHTEEYKEMMRQRMSGANNHKSRKVVCVETGEVFVSLSDVARSLGIGVSNISACVRGEQKTAGKYHWKYYDEEEAIR